MDEGIYATPARCQRHLEVRPQNVERLRDVPVIRPGQGRRRRRRHDVPQEPHRFRIR